MFDDLGQGVDGCVYAAQRPFYPQRLCCLLHQEWRGDDSALLLDEEMAQGEETDWRCFQTSLTVPKGNHF